MHGKGGIYSISKNRQAKYKLDTSSNDIELIFSMLYNII